MSSSAVTQLLVDAADKKNESCGGRSTSAAGHCDAFALLPSRAAHDRHCLSSPPWAAAHIKLIDQSGTNLGKLGPNFSNFPKTFSYVR